MATTVVDLNFEDAKLEFSGSSEEDIAFAKTFWQSVQLLPPMESRLVSSDIKQRLKVAPPGHQSVNITYPDREEPNKLQEFLTKAKIQEKEEEVKKLKSLAEKRHADRSLLEKHRQTRMQKESISAKQKPVREDLERYVMPIDDEEFIEEDCEDAEKVFNDLDKFDQRFQHDSDSD